MAKHKGIPAWLENSPEDKAEDRREAKKRNITVAAYEGSADDEAADRRLINRMREKVRSARSVKRAGPREWRAPS